MRTHERRGMALYLAAGLAFMAALFIFTYHGFMRNQTQQAHVLLQGEIAYYLAQAGISAGIARFMNNKDETPLHKMLISSDCDAANSADSETIPVEGNPALTALMEEQPDAALAVELSLEGFKPAFSRSESESGIVYNTVEKSGWLKVAATAVVGPARRRLVAFKNVRVLSALPYVLGKFTLFEIAPETPGANSLDRFQYEKTGMTSGRPIAGAGALPAIVTHGPGPTPEDRGWVFLGGGPRKLNLAWGRVGEGEEFHLLEKPWKVTADPDAPEPLPADFQLLLMEKGFFRGIHADNNLFDLFDFQQPAGDPVSENAGLLHLFGTDTDRSPTFVLGEVYRRYLSLRYAVRQSDGEYTHLPWAAASGWSAAPPSPWTANPPWDVKRDTFGDRYDNYAHAMSQPVEESYNRSIDFMTAAQYEVDPPRTAVAPGLVRHRFGVADFLYRPALNNGEVLIRSNTGQRLFDGNLHGLLMDDFYFAARAPYRLPSGSFGSFLALKSPRVPGILHVTGGDVTIDRPLVVRDGGVIAFDGRVTIAATVRVTEGIQPLVIASLSSDVVVATPAPIEASLIALAGRVRGNGGGFDVRGGMAAGTIEWSGLLSGSGRSALTWNPALDPTVPENRPYRVYVSPSRDQYMPGGAN